jgi:hypothetical protein
MHMLCRNRVADFDAWWAVFGSHADVHRAAGLQLQRLWRSVDDPNEVFFMFQVDDRRKADDFIAAPESAQAGKDAGVIEGDYHFIIAVD